MSIFFFIILFFLFLFNSIENIYINDFSLKEDSLKENSILNELEQINYNNIDNILNNKDLYFSENKNKYKVLNDLSDNSRTYRDIINNSTFAVIPENLISRFEDKYQLERRIKIIRNIEKQENNINIHQNNNNIIFMEIKQY